LNTNVTNYMHSIACRIINTARHLNTGNTNYIQIPNLRKHHLNLTESLHLDEIVLIVSVCDLTQEIITYVGTLLLQQLGMSSLFGNFAFCETVDDICLLDR
jgi:hypothetical protein